MTLPAKLQAFVRKDVPLAPYTWFRLGGTADHFAEPRSVDELQQVIAWAREQDLPMRLLGGGSNLLVSSDKVPGVVIHLAAPAFSEINIEGQLVTAGGGAKLGHVISSAVREGLAGLEPLVGIPGTIGGALHGNAGGHGGDIGQWTETATVMTRVGQIQVRQRSEMDFGYRTSSLDELVILSAVFRLEPADPVELTKRMQKLWIVKKASQPLGHQSAGCVFRNPRGLSAGALVDQAGLKGMRVGGAEVSDRHANFIVTDETATADDVLKLIDLVRQRVLERLGVDLELEIELW